MKFASYINLKKKLHKALMKVTTDGFHIKKTDLTKENLKKIKEDLTVVPESNFGNFVKKSFKVYIETPEELILPIYYIKEAFPELLKKAEIDFPESSQIDISDNINLRPHQIQCFNNCIKEFDKPYGGGIITLNTGMGKCLAKGTKVIMYNGNLKKVEDLVQGDTLMGDDNTPRRILTLTKGYGKLYDIVPVTGETFTVNKAHILVLKNSEPKPVITCRTSYNRIRYNVIWWENNELHNKLFKTKEEAETFMSTVQHQLYSEISVSDWLKTSKAFRNTFKAYRVPINFNNETLSEKLDIISGKLKTDYRIIGDKVIVKYNRDFMFLLLSAGYKTIKLSPEEMSIQGDFTLLSINFPLSGNKKDYSMTNIKLRYRERGEYYGFTLDGNHRFLFEDFTVTHNTVLSLKLICHSKKKTLVLVNKVELLNQWKNEILKWIPEAKIGIVQGSKFKFEECDIIIGMLQTIAIKKELKAIDFHWVDLCIIDECHNTPSNVFSNIIFKLRPRYLFGLTATLERKDKLDILIKWYMGDILYDGRDKDLKQTTDVYCLKFIGSSSVDKFLRDGTPAVATMLSNISLDIDRNNDIINLLKELIKDKNRNILVISDRISQLKYLHKALPDDSGLFIGSMKSAALEESKTKQILLGTYPLVNEGFNHPKLNCLIFATPRSSIIQAIGRIYRKAHSDITPIIIDIIDDFSIFKRQFYRRRKIYKTSIKNCKLITQNLEDFKIENVLQFSDTESEDSQDIEDTEKGVKCLLDFDED